MDFLFTFMKWNQRLKKSLPTWLLRTIRDIIESSAFLWKRSYYGQFGEDAVLQNIFRSQAWRRASRTKADTIEKRFGFYVDVGAFAPVQHSNTYWFYRRGWRAHFAGFAAAILTLNLPFPAAKVNWCITVGEFPM